MKKTIRQQLSDEWYRVQSNFSFFARFLCSRLRLYWARLYVRKDEFHSSLDLDMDTLATMNKKEQEWYFNDLARRRKIAHEREFQDF